MSKFRGLLAMALALAGLGVFAASAGAALPIKFGGDPLTVYVNEVGRCQSSYANFGGNYYPGFQSAIEEGGLADCGFFIATPSKPTTGTAQPLALQGPEIESVKAGRVFGFDGQAGPGGFSEPTELESPRLLYVPVSNVGPTGTGTTADPYKVVTIYAAYVGNPTVSANKYFEVTQTTEYVSGNPYFTVNFDVKNTSTETVYYRAIYAGDLFVNGNDVGTGVFLAGPPRFVGGQNQTSGVLGGFQEDLQAFDGSATPAWSSYGEDYWAATETGGIWHEVENSANATNAFPDSVNAEDIDNGAGVAWDTNYSEGHGLAPGHEQEYSIVNFTTVPSILQVNPTAQGLTQGATATITVTAANNGSQPYANTPLRYTITGANPMSGVVNTDAQGVAQIHDVGTNAGVDLVSMYLDLGNSGSQVAADPTGTAQVTFVPRPPTPPPPNSSVTIKAVTVNANGTITITYVPDEAGTGTLTVTVPTASVARRHTKKCTRGTIKINGHCLPRTSVIGIAKGAGTPGVPLTLTVKPSAKVRRALGKGRNLHVLATLTYQSARGGQPSTYAYHLVVKGRKHRHRRH
jgi:hypothetical protein